MAAVAATTTTETVREETAELYWSIMGGTYAMPRSLYGKYKAIVRDGNDPAKDPDFVRRALNVAATYFNLRSMELLSPGGRVRQPGPRDTYVFRRADLRPLDGGTGRRLDVLVYNTTTSAAIEMFARGDYLPTDYNEHPMYGGLSLESTPPVAPRRIGVLDMANAGYALAGGGGAGWPGGGWHAGAHAQEEALCRETDLLAHIYDTRQGGGDWLVSARVPHGRGGGRGGPGIRSPGDLRVRSWPPPFVGYPLVPGGRLIVAKDVHQTLVEAGEGVFNEPFPWEYFRSSYDPQPTPGFTVAISAMPVFTEGDPGDAVYRHTANMVVSALARAKCTHLVLGAHGAGAFRNPADRVARAYLSALREYGGSIECVIFAILEATPTVGRRAVLFPAPQALYAVKRLGSDFVRVMWEYVPPVLQTAYTAHGVSARVQSTAAPPRPSAPPAAADPVSAPRRRWGRQDYAAAARRATEKRKPACRWAGHCTRGLPAHWEDYQHGRQELPVGLDADGGGGGCGGGGGGGGAKSRVLPGQARAAPPFESPTA